MLTFPDRVLLAEVGPRDGLQSLPKWIDTGTKVRMIDRLSEAGMPVIEITSFVHPRVVPNMRDAEEVCARIERRPGVIYRALAPNARGAERAAAARIGEILGLITVSPTYTRKNQNMTIDEAVDQAIAAFRIADSKDIPFVMALGMAFWCPYEGPIPEANVIELMRRFHSAGMRRFYLAGSIGMEDPRHVNRLFARLYDQFPDTELGFHVHNLSGMATANVLAALDAGVHWIEGAICGIGGGMAMPTALGGVGNFPTEDLVTMLAEMGVATGLDPKAVLAAARDIASLLGIEARSHTANGGTREAVLAWGRSHPHEHP